VILKENIVSAVKIQLAIRHLFTFQQLSVTSECFKPINEALYPKCQLSKQFIIQ